VGTIAQVGLYIATVFYLLLPIIGGVQMFQFQFNNNNDQLPSVTDIYAVLFTIAGLVGATTVCEIIGTSWDSSATAVLTRTHAKFTATARQHPSKLFVNYPDVRLQHDSAVFGWVVFVLGFCGMVTGYSLFLEDEFAAGTTIGVMSTMAFYWGAYIVATGNRYLANVLRNLSKRQITEIKGKIQAIENHYVSGATAPPTDRFQELNKVLDESVQTITDEADTHIMITFGQTVRRLTHHFL